MTATDIPDFALDHGSKGKVVVLDDGDGPTGMAFRPSGTNYELHLAADGYDGPVGKLMRGMVRVRGRKVYNVPSGGNFIAPIVGEPRIVQGRVLAGDDRTLVVHAGCTVIVDLPRTPDAIDLHGRAVEPGLMINVVCMPGARLVSV
ncbi:MAG: hypothetical protein AAF593_14195 [Planctomycetota bacterium]